MCYNTKQTRKVQELEIHYRIGLMKNNYPLIDDNALRQAFDIPAYQLNGFDHPFMLVITSEYPDELRPAKWGIAPHNYSTEMLSDYYNRNLGATLNAQSEKAFSNELYYHSVFERRCVIPVDGLYEPHTLPNTTKKKEKVPFVFEYKDKSVISLAGIYNVLRNSTNNKDYTVFTIFTRRATPLFQEVHNKPAAQNGYRMPLILNNDLIDDWLNEEITTAYLKELLLTEPEKELTARPVTRDVYRRVDSNYEGVDEFHDYHIDPQGLKFDFTGYKPHLFGAGPSDLFS